MSVHIFNETVHEAVRDCRRGLVAAGGFSLLVNLLILALPIYSLQVFDRVLSSQSVNTLLMLTVITVSLLALQASFDHLRGTILRRTAGRFEHALAGATLRVAIHESARGNSHASAGIRDLREVHSALARADISALFDVPWTPIFLLVVTLIHPAIGLFVLSAVALLAMLTLIGVMAARRDCCTASQATHTANEQFDVYLSNAEAIEAMGMSGDVQRRWMEENKREGAINAMFTRRLNRVYSAAKLLRLLVQIGVTGLGAWLVLRQQLTPGAMIASSLLMARALAPVERAVGGSRNFSSAWGAFRRLKVALSAAALPKNSVALPAPAGNLYVSGLTFRPENYNKSILHGLSFRLDTGNTLAIIGHSGAGKSTLARMLAGVYKATEGTIRIDGADITNWDRNVIGKHIGYMPQNVQMLNGTVGENISRHELAPSSEKIITAAQSAGVHDLILGLPQGYDTKIGAGGLRLSGGQLQRIGLARALYGEPRLLILDEPNSNLDPEGEAALARVLRTSRDAGRTVVVVTHRSVLLRSVDWIIAMREGSILCAGSAGEVMGKLEGLRSAVQSPRGVNVVEHRVAA